MLVQYGPSSSTEAGVIQQFPGGLRVIIHTAHYIYADCTSKEQGLWWQDFPIQGNPRPQGGSGIHPPASAASSAHPSGSLPPGARFSSDLERYLARLKLPVGMAVR